MSFSYSKEFSIKSYSVVENTFIKDYLPFIPGDAVKVYLYGLYLCGKENDKSIEEISQNLSIDASVVLESLKCLEEFELISVLSTQPLKVNYLPIKTQNYTKPRKINAEKYTEFTKCIQALLPNRMISTNEYTEYFNIMESYKIMPDAMYMIVKYCVDRKGEDISYRYIIKVAKDFGNRDITTCEKVENELSSYVSRTAIIEKILQAMSVKRQPDIDDNKLLKKWTGDYDFEPENIILVAKNIKHGNMEKLDNQLMKLFSAKCFAPQEIKDYFEKKQNIFDLTVKINKSLSVYVEVLDAEIDTYINKWLSFGFMEDGLLYISSYCFRNGNNTLEYMDNLIESLRNKGVIHLSSICDYFEEQKKDYDFISEMLLTCGLNRKPTNWDSENIGKWKSWNFSNEMILEAAKLAAGKSSPIGYMHGILSNWKNNYIFNKSDITDKQDKSSTNSLLEYNREYERRRLIADSTAQKNLEKAMELQGFSDIYQRLFSIEKDIAFAQIACDKDAENKLIEEKQNLQSKQEILLSSIGLNSTDLSPKYKCDKCHDTGFNGTEKCDCYEKFLNK